MIDPERALFTGPSPEEGVPANLSAAALDAIDWLDWLEQLLAAAAAAKRLPPRNKYAGDDVRTRLQRAKIALERFVEPCLPAGFTPAPRERQWPGVVAEIVASSPDAPAKKKSRKKRD